MSRDTGRGGGGEVDVRAVMLAARTAIRVAAGWKFALAAAAALVPALLLAGFFFASSGTALGGEGSLCTVRGTGSSDIPAGYVPWLQRAATKYKLGPRGFSIVAAIHYVESDFGRSPLPGVAPGTQNFAGAEGPGQFLVSSWEAYGVDANGDGVRDPYSIPDSVFATANLLHADGAPRDWKGAIFDYNHANWYVEEVEARAAHFGARIVCAPDPQAPGGALLKSSRVLYRPRSFKAIPARLWVGGGQPESVDSRIWHDAVWLLETYDLRVTAARETGHQTHGDGTAMDMVPAAGHGWDETALRAATDLGWTASCGASGSAPTCPLVPAIQFIGYNGYPGHGDPAHAGSNAHLHVSWKSSDYGCPGLCSPRTWVMAFGLG
jgi:hypothetical protein